MERIQVLKDVEPRTQQIFDEACRRFLDRAAEDDILDALVLAVTAYRGCGRLQTFPNQPPKDAKGLTMEMVYYTPRPSDRQSLCR